MGAVSWRWVRGAIYGRAMASNTGNEAVRALRQRQEVERRAVRAVEQSAGVLDEAHRRRREALARLDEEVREAAAAHDVAVATLATVLRDDGLAAELSGLDVTRVRALRRSVDAAAVRSRIQELGSVVPRRRGSAVAWAADSGRVLGAAASSDDVRPAGGVVPAGRADAIGG